MLKLQVENHNFWNKNTFCSHSESLGDISVTYLSYEHFLEGSGKSPKYVGIERVRFNCIKRYLHCNLISSHTLDLIYQKMAPV